MSKYSPSGKPVDSESYYNDVKNKTGNICFDCNKKKDEYICDKCGETKLGRYWFNKEKNDDKKFCSDNCFGIYYGYYVENCQECSKKLFKSYRSYCSTCERKHEAEIRREEAEKRKKTKELKDSCNNDLGTVNCRYCGEKCSSIFDVCDKKECLDKMNKGTESKDKSREKEKQNQQKRTSLLSKISQLEQIPNRTPEQEAELKRKRQELAELEGKNREEQEPSKDKNLGLKIGVGIGVVGLLLVIIAVIVKKSRE